MRKRKEHSPVGIDTAEELRFEIHVIEAVRTDKLENRLHADEMSLLVDNLIPIWFDLDFRDILKGFFPGKIKGNK
jgi:hypothetical protein